MRIGEVARLAGITTRAVRHYHHVGLLPEPPRLGNGYRAYGLRDAVLLVRVRRLTELGLSLDEVRDVLADDAGRDLAEVLEELDDDLARQEAEVRVRRERLAVLLEQAREGRLPAEGPVSPELAALFADMARLRGGRAGPEPRTAVLDRELLTLMDGVHAGEEGTRMVAAMRGAVASPEGMERAYDLYARLDELADAGEDDPGVAAAAELLAGLLPGEVAAAVRDAGGDAGADVVEAWGGDAFADAFLAEFSPAQAEVVRRALRLAADRAGAGATVGDVGCSGDGDRDGDGDGDAGGDADAGGEGAGPEGAGGDGAGGMGAGGAS
ncbi:MerR family transcriptional regulator [Streptomyces fradiae]|uniref:MerR family transcriptional regulator n=1 Tax=Streptomyces fradiae TaxID=1906 RepID=UPI002943459B|nr:MerR family transcriptional regulator [Streptomyces fradiae]WOI59643.1 MerR family transcriptional regulator [Streptomyces fradiae]